MTYEIASLAPNNADFLLVIGNVRSFLFDGAEVVCVVSSRGVFWRKKKAIPLPDLFDVEVYNPPGRKRMTIVNLVLHTQKRIFVTDSMRRREAFDPLAKAIRPFLSAGLLQ